MKVFGHPTSEESGDKKETVWSMDFYKMRNEGFVNEWNWHMERQRRKLKSYGDLCIDILRGAKKE